MLLSLFAALCSIGHAKVDLNIKSEGLRNIHSPPRHSNSGKSFLSQHNLISLDLAGEIQTHISSPLKDGSDEISTQPLLNWRASSNPIGFPIPHVHMGAQYDFRKYWFGATRFISTLSWGQSKRDDIGTKLRVEVGHDFLKDYSVQWNIESRRHKTNDTGGINPKAMVRYDTRHKSNAISVGASASLHPRMKIFSKVSMINKESDVFRKSFVNLIPQEKFNWSEGSWLPEVKMTAGGEIIAASSIGLPRGTSPRNRVAVRLMARRQMNWNIIGFFNGSYEDEVNETLVKIELGARGQDGSSYTSISAEAALERLRDSWWFTVGQERLILM